jgi:hypothetical protein
VTDEIPADLIQLKRDHIRIQGELAALSKTLPNPLAVVAGTAEDDPGGREQWTALHAELGDLTMQIHRHPAWDGLSMPDRLKLDQEASRAARQPA